MKNFKCIIELNKTIIAFCLTVLFLTGCGIQNKNSLLMSSNDINSLEYSSFTEYVEQTEKLLRANRHFLTENIEQEIQANLPFEIKPQIINTETKGVLLVHGLGDSPYSFIDIAKSLADKGFLVRTVLLQGHGTKPSDLLDTDYKDWEKLVSKQVALLKKEVGNVYLGGFSTGANLVYSYAVKDFEIKGLMLFSPAFQSNEPLLFMTPFLATFKDWHRETNLESQTNYARYSNVPINAFAQYYHTSDKALDNLDKSIFARPVFMVLTEHDSVLDAKYIKELFDTRFINSKSILLWYGHTKARVEDKTRYINSYVPELSISNMSHMGIVFSPENPYYGINGSERMCINSSEAVEEDVKACKEGTAVWYSAWIEDEKHLKSPNFHARLTFNPYFKVMINDLFEVFDF